MTNEVLAIVVSVVALIIAGVSIWKAQKPVTFEGVTTALQVATPQAKEIIAIVEAGVFAAEQLKSTGKLPDNNAAFEYALRFAQKMLPDLSRETLTTFIESSVLVAHQIAAAATAAPPSDTKPLSGTFTGRQS